jgi:hypothetical protein
MADSIAVTPAGVKYNPDDMTDGNNPLARYHTEGKIAAAQESMTERAFQHMITEGKIAAAMADMAAREAAAKADQDMIDYNQYGKIEAAIHNSANPGLFLDPPKK